MSFITNSLFRPLAQWYSEINPATLTGAIDVLVIEQEDGSFVSSPFHVRFGKLGVLKAKEKVVDIEINDEPVDIHMKLDDHGTAFFVEDVSDTEDDEIPPELATSPIPDVILDDNNSPGSSPKSAASRSLTEAFNNNNVCDEKKPESECQIKPDIASGEATGKLKLNRKKRKRRQFHNSNRGHSRSGSKSSLLEMTQGHNDQGSSTESGEGTPATSGNGKTGSEKTEESVSDVFDLEDNDNDGDLDDDENEPTPINSLVVSSTPRDLSSLRNDIEDPQDLGDFLAEKAEKLLVHQPSFSSQKSDGAEQSFLQSRLGDEAIESILETQEKLNEDSPSVLQQPRETNYFSEPEMTSPNGSRPSSPVLSDTEYETKRQDSEERGTEQSWEWGKLPTTNTGVVQSNININAEVAQTEAESKEDKRQRRWTLSSFWSTSQASKNATAETKVGAEKKKEKKVMSGVYLDDLKDDEEMMAIYVGSSRHDPNMHFPPLGTGMQIRAVDDDAESGNGPSLPMSPHSVDGAIGGPRIRYDSSDEDRHLGSKLLPDMALSLCGGLEGTDQSFSSAMFEQSLVSYDDFAMRLKNNDDIFSNPDLVVRIGQQYYTWQAACPIVMSTVLYGRTLPSDLVKVIKGSYQEAITSKESSPNSKIARSTSWWPFSSRREGLDEHGKKVEHPQPEGTSLLISQETKITMTGIKGSQPEVTSVVKVEVTDEKDSKKARFEPGGGSRTSSEGGDSDPDLKRLSLVVQQDKRFRKTLRLTTDAIKQLNLKPGSNEAQFSVTTAYQGTSRCKCHIYWWKSTDKIVISDIDGTITKSDVLGHVLPIIGRDWAQSGVASLFSKIASNGYHIAYLSARAIGQASITKDYLSSIRQGDMNLPDGPLFLNPTSLVNAFHREVIEKKPEKFKIACLRDIQKLFPEDRNPFYAGYGNRVNDVFAYRTVGIPISRIFTINSKGELRHELTQTFLTSYGCQSSIVDHIFPPFGENTGNPSAQQEYSSFTYWREPIPLIDVEEPTDSNAKKKNP